MDKGISRSQVWTRAIVRPMKLLFMSPIVFVLSFYAAFLYGLNYLIYTTISFIFVEHYDFTTGTSGLSYLGLAIGFACGLFAFGLTSDKTLAKLAAKNGGRQEPEFRLPIMTPGALLIPISFFWYGWSVQANVHW